MTYLKCLKFIVIASLLMIETIFSTITAVNVISITVSGINNAKTITTNDGTLQMIATVLPADATVKTVKWSVKNGTGSAKIDTNGLLTALTNGAVTVTATASDGSGVFGDCEITISGQLPFSITSPLQLGRFVTPYTPEPYTITIVNKVTGTITLDKSEKSIGGYLDVGNLSKTTLVGEGDFATFTIQPKAGLWIGEKEDRINIRANNSLSSTLIVYFEIFSTYSKWIVDNWNRNKEQVFKLADEQDKFVLLLIGPSSCNYCLTTSDIFYNPEMSSLKKVIEDNYIPWYSNSTIGLEYFTGVAVANPRIAIINPEPDVSVASISGLKNADELQQFLTIDLLTGSELKWRKNMGEVVQLAKNQNKYILKFTGRGTSNNSQKVMKLLNTGTLKKLLEDNYILWYSDEVPATVVTLPVISVIYPDYPDIVLDKLNGLQDVIAFENLFEQYTVANDRLFDDNKVSVFGGVLSISNPTNNELIRIYSPTGQSIATVYKNDYTVRIDASHFPKGILIIHSSAGWNAKILIK